MTERALLIDDNPPAVTLSGGPSSYGILDPSMLDEVIVLTEKAWQQASAITPADGSVNELRVSVMDLADATRMLTNQLQQVARGVRTGRIAVAPRES